MLRYSTAANSHGISEDAGPRSISVHRLLEIYAAWCLRRRQRAELYALSDRMLQDIGVSRWEIESIVGSPNRDASARPPAQPDGTLLPAETPGDL